MATKSAKNQERIGRVGALREGDFVAFARRGNGDVLTPAEAKLVRRGEAQLRRGESKSWRTVKNS